MINWLLKYYPLVFLVFNGVFWLIVYVLHKTYAKRESVDFLEKEVLLINANINNLPDKAEIHSLDVRLEYLSGDIRRLETGILGIRTTLEMLLENELKGKQ